MAIIGRAEGQQPASWLARGLQHARRIGRIERTQGDQRLFGTGFLFEGKLLGDSWVGLPLLLTAFHVIAPLDASSNEVKLDGIRVVFEGMYEDAGANVVVKAQRLLASSPVDQLNYALLLLDRWPGQISDMRLAPRSPSPGEPVHVFGYPLGGGLSFTTDNNEVIDVPHPETAAIHGGGWLPSIRDAALLYRAPTQPGSSGSAVFNQFWEAVAIHVATLIPVANVGVLLKVIVPDMVEQLRNVKLDSGTAQMLRASAVDRSSGRESNADYYSVFISYSHADSLFAERLYINLNNLGIRAWLDKKDILAGDDIYEEVAKGIEIWDKVLLCCSKSSLTSWWVDSEIDRAFEKERNLFRTRGHKVFALVPLNLDGYLFDGWESGKAQVVRARKAADFTGWEDVAQFNAAFTSLVDALRADERKRAIPPKPKL